MPIYDAAIAARLFEMTRRMLSDNVKGSRLCSNGMYEHVITLAEPMDSQMEFYREAYRMSGSKDPPV